MDDFSIVDHRLYSALDELRLVNRYLGGYSGTLAGFKALNLVPNGTPLRVLDLGTGLADIPEFLVRHARRNGHSIEVTGIDANQATVAYTNQTLDRRLDASLRRQIHVVRGDALAPSFESGSFDVALAALFTHHLSDDEVVLLLREMHRVARQGIIVNDLHRHPVAYHSFRAVAAAFRGSPMVRHDGPLSVLRAFRRRELLELARRAELPQPRIRWHWAFRWILTARTDGAR